ncbi:MAG: PAS domain-containing sensor histidine kinase [Byssovorax sp.]
MSPLNLEQYRALVEHAPAMVWRTGLDAKCDYFNATWLAFTGRALDQEVGNAWAEGVHPDDLDRCLKIYHESFEARRPFEIEYRLRRADGIYRYLFDRGVPYHDAEGQFAGFIGSCVDVDDRRKADEAKQVFLTMIAHELRTPLMTLGTASTLLRRRLVAGKDPEPTIASIERQVARFVKMVASLGEAASLEAGRGLALDAVSVDVWALIRDTVESQQEVLRARVDQRHTLTLDAPTTALALRADADRLYHVLLGLIENAIKFSPSGGVVAVRGEVQGGAVVLSVSDSGIGVPAADQPSLFQRFFRAGNAPPENFPGLGLGLSITREIVEAHGGQVSLQSHVGEGTTVTITLPLAGKGADS